MRGLLLARSQIRFDIDTKFVLSAVVLVSVLVLELFIPADMVMGRMGSLFAFSET